MKSLSSDTKDIKKTILSDNYSTVYRKLTYLTKTTPETISFTLHRDCDAIANLDCILTLENPDDVSINTILSKITVKCGGQIFDSLSAPDLETQLQVNSQLFKTRTISRHGNTLVVPLIMAPCMPNNLLSLLNLEFHEIEITLHTHSDAKASIWGDAYYLDQPKRKSIAMEKLEMLTYQNQYKGPETLCPGINTFRLNFNHPVDVIYFWGFDTSKVVDIKLLINHQVYIETNPTMLEVQKKRMGYTFDPLAIFFTDHPCQHNNASLNFSRIENATLMVTTQQDGDTPMYIVGLNRQPVLIQQGKAGLRFSK